MITKEEIDNLVSRAKRSLAIKTVKYWTKVAFGNPCKKELEKLRLIKFYINILEAFKFVDSTQECNCCIESTFETELINGFPETKATFEFLQDNKGYFIYNGVGYTFTYEYIESQKLLTINFDFLESPLVFSDIVFDENCNLSNGQNTESILQLAEIEVTGTPVNAPGYDGFFVIYNESDDIFYQLDIPQNIITSPEDIVALWNSTFGNTGFSMTFDDEKYKVSAPLNSGDYSTWTASFQQIEGGLDPNALFIQPFIIPFNGQNSVDSTCIIVPNLSDFTGSGLITVETSTGGIIYGASLNYTIDRFIENFNLSNTEGLSVQIVNGELVFNAPVGSYAGFNGTNLIITSYITGLEIYTNSFSGGITTTAGSFTVTLLDPSTNPVQILYSDTTIVNYNSFQELVDNFNNSPNNLGFSLELVNDFGGVFVDFKFNAPENTFGQYNDYQIEFIFSYAEQPENNIQEYRSFLDGEWPALVRYDSLFDDSGNIGDLINTNECSPTTVQLTCLTNENAESIFNHLKMLI